MGSKSSWVLKIRVLNHQGTPLCHPHLKATFKKPQDRLSSTQETSLRPIFHPPPLQSHSGLISSVSILVPNFWWQQSPRLEAHTLVPGRLGFNPRSANYGFSGLGQVI